jgi:hypothetical protein
MSLVYRAVWQDVDHVPPAVLEDEFRAWCISKGLEEIDVPYRGTIKAGTTAVDVRRGDSESGRVYRGRLEEWNDDGRRWTTTATALVSNDFRGYWIDLECEDPNSTRGIPMAAPRLVRQILAEEGSPARGPVPIAAHHFVVRPGETVNHLLELLRDPDRDLPLVVFSPDERSDVATNDERALLAAETLAGVAHVSLLSPNAVVEFNAALPDGMKVYGGAMRMYLPGFEDADDPTRHRYWGLYAIRAYPRRAGQLVAQRLTTTQRWITPPPAWDDVRYLVARPTEEEFAVRRAAIVSELPGGADDVDSLRREREELLQLLVNAERERDEAIEESRKETARLAIDIDRLQSEVIDDIGAMESLTDENDALRRNLRLVLSAGARPADNDAIDLDQVEVPLTPSAAIDLARRTLAMVEIPDDAVREVDRLDASVKDRVWAAHTWHGLLALHRYAEAVRDGIATGGFYVWCQRTSSWPDSKIAMVESDTVMRNDELAGRRYLPVSTDVVTSGTIFMGAHLKIQTGGGMNIPRLYFHDDTKGVTGKVHVGFYGPHDLTPNTKTN